jgi:hypothetical protein
MKLLGLGDLSIYLSWIPPYYRSIGVRRIHRTGGRNHCLSVRPWFAIVDVCRG